nr:DUF6615 family protein [Pedobacter miscanthi]
MNEEGITRNTVIGLIQDYTESQRDIDVFVQKAKKEVETGADLEVYFEAGRGKFKRILLQAKLMEPDGCFEHLDRYSGSTGRKQYDTLSSFAKEVESEAYYLMYNGYHGYKETGTDCSGNYDERQLGCAIMQIGEIKDHCEKKSTGKMGNIGSPKPFGKPWRQLSCCNQPFAKTKLYSAEEIDYDPYFKQLFSDHKSGAIEFINQKKFIDEMLTTESNKTIHVAGWNPAARIIVSENTMRKNGRGKLEL